MDATSTASISVTSLQQALASADPPLVIDVRRAPAFRESLHLVRGALRRDPERVADWARSLPRGCVVVVACVYGHDVSRDTAAALAGFGIKACYLEGGVEGWREHDGATTPKPAGAATRWVTRERPKIDRIACPWLVRRFIDPEAEFLYVAAAEVRKVAAERSAVPYDVPEVEFAHRGERCSFDAFLEFYRLRDPALEALALIVRGADTARPELAPQAAGLAAVSLGLSRLYRDDHEMLEHGMLLYDALYAWCREGKDELHTWKPEAYR